MNLLFLISFIENDALLTSFYFNPSYAEAITLVQSTRMSFSSLATRLCDDFTLLYIEACTYTYFQLIMNS